MFDHFFDFVRKVLSYLMPIRLKTYFSKINGELEVNLISGRKILDTNKSNYSYGSLQKILHKGLSEIRFDNTINRILVLGLGGGSIIQTIREDFRSGAFIELIDIDSEIIAIAKSEFEVDKYENISIIQADAFDYLIACSEPFNIIIVDLFIVDEIPKIFTGPDFINELTKHLSPGGKIVYNTFRKTMLRELFNQIKAEFLKNGLEVKVLEKVQFTNDLIIAENKTTVNL